MLKRRIIILAVLAAALALCFALIACSANSAASFDSDDQTAEEEQTATGDGEEATLEEEAASLSKDDPYISDEICLSCHGGSYAALEETTADLGDSNPHGGTHGVGGLACNICHVNGSQVPTDEENMCLDCHAWPREEQSLIEYMDLDE